IRSNKLGAKNRLYHTLRISLMRSGLKRAKYLRDKKVMNYVGENVLYMPIKVPLYPTLIKIHSNVRIASNVSFITHDAVHRMLNRKFGIQKYQENIGCIEIEENVFVGSNSIIMYDVKIGS